MYKGFIANHTAYAHLIDPTLIIRNTNTTMRHTALLLGTLEFSATFCRVKKKKKKKNKSHVSYYLLTNILEGPVSRSNMAALL